ncbi:predicted protein [Naegleria gruberi]|uniref:Predicted protein n=1 Tax=Naegleria gruberi TaxID=5762 RepID=D2UZ48_NAEGR|nr:uncharacterized protein NAEGRDRAFT_45394 [Naegleria gruberi]EFC50091.1 predicted protein [Naegleria gruberi]|eukprot:XP_002682835.1 predicted protein [Naegleria gruberi strain NEG-M]
MVDTLNIQTIRTVHTLCCVTSKKACQLFMQEMHDYWKKVSNVLEMVVYWKRYQSFEGFSLARGDISVYDSVSLVKMQKLIEATEMNSNREYSQIIDPSMCGFHYQIPVDLDGIPNDFANEEVNKLFEERVDTLMISESKFEKIKSITQLEPYDLYLHKAFILVLDMITYFDSERFKNDSYMYWDTLERSCLISKGLVSSNPTDRSLGFVIDMETDIESLMLLRQLEPTCVALSINFTSEHYQQFVIPNKYAQFLCFSFQIPNETSTEYDNFLDGQEFPNVIDLTIRLASSDSNYYFKIDTERLERNILSAITRKKFPKLLRISIQGCSCIYKLLEQEIFSELAYVEIIPQTDRDMELYNWSERRVHNFINHHFIEKDHSLIHQLVVHAKIVRNDPDAKYDTIKELYDMSRGKFAACISHSSINEYYDRCYE